MMQDNLIILLATIAAAVVIFLLMRQVNLWYFRINEGIAILERQENLLRKIAGEPVPEKKTNLTAGIDPSKWSCSKCGMDNDMSRSVCWYCNQKGKD